MLQYKHIRWKVFPEHLLMITMMKVTTTTMMVMVVVVVILMLMLMEMVVRSARCLSFRCGGGGREPVLLQ